MALLVRECARQTRVGVLQESHDLPRGCDPRGSIERYVLALAGLKTNLPLDSQVKDDSPQRDRNSNCCHKLATIAATASPNSPPVKSPMPLSSWGRHFCQAAHIVSYSECEGEFAAGQADPDNGVWLATHLRQAFDRGLFAIRLDGTVVWSKQLSKSDLALAQTLAARIPVRESAAPYPLRAIRSGRGRVWHRTRHAIRPERPLGGHFLFSQSVTNGGLRPLHLNASRPIRGFAPPGGSRAAPPPVLSIAAPCGAADLRSPLMIRVAIIAAAYHAICSKLSEDEPPWPVHRRDGQVPIPTSRRPSSTVSPQCGGEESYSDAILAQVIRCDFPPPPYFDIFCS